MGYRSWNAYEQDAEAAHRARIASLPSLRRWRTRFTLLAFAAVLLCVIAFAFAGRTILNLFE